MAPLQNSEECVDIRRVVLRVWEREGLLLLEDGVERVPVKS